jgi:UDP-hydrolysing UDP-N-acetyl-D-glucosamine 2-epimerase
MTKKVAIVTTSRADYSIYRPVLMELGRRPLLSPMIVASGTHLSPQHGMTVTAIEADGFPVTEQVPLLVAGDDGIATNKSMALGLLGFSDVFQRIRPDIVLVLGDRYEMFSAALAALSLNIPIGHIHGGELTIGAFDDSIRHSITKLSHLHFVSCVEAAIRVRQLGEDPQRIFLVGAPALDALSDLKSPPLEAVLERVGLGGSAKPVLATFHPTTRDLTSPIDQVTPMLDALAAAGLPVILTAPNADPGGAAIRATLDAFVKGHPQIVLSENLGPTWYFAAMRHAAFMIGNSSSGILEAASFGLPVIDIGSRQEGRTRGANVLHCDNDAAAIKAAIGKVTSDGFAKLAAETDNPYFAGGAASKIADAIEKSPARENLIHKQFHDLPSAISVN